MRLGDVSSPPPTPQPQSIEDIFEGIFGDEPVFTTSQVDDDEYEYNQNASPSPTLNTTKSSKIFAGYTGKTSKSKKSTNKSKSSHSPSSMDCSKSTKSGSDGSMYEKNEKKSSQSTKTKRCSSKSGKSSLSYPSVEGKADKGGDDDPSLMILEQMRYKMGNGGRRSGGIELLLLMVTLITMSSYLVWQ